METEEFFLIFAILMLFFDLIQLFSAKPREKRKLEYGFYATTLAFGLIVISYFTLVQAFLKDDFSVKEVYSYSSTSSPAMSKIYASWGGAGGSILFLTLLISIVYFAYRFRTYKRRSAYSINTSWILDLILIFFLILTLMKNPFERFSGTPPIDGRGLNPQLQTFWMIVHPPIVFSGYAFVLLAFALTLAGMKTGEKKEDRMLKLSIQAAWLFLTLGISIGGVWAYEVLGWGGYWSWDPVETASLLPWLALTAYFHLRPLSEKNKSLTRELMILMAFAALIFLSALARGGLRTSVHAYALSPAGPFLLLFGLGMTLYFFYLKSKIEKPLFSLQVEKSSLYSVSFFIGYVSLLFIFLVCFFGVAYPIIQGIFFDNPSIQSVDFYNNWNFPFVMAFVVALIGCSIHGKIGLKKFAVFIAGALIAGAILAQVRLPTPNMLADFGIPLLIAALFAVVYRLVRVQQDEKRSLRLFGRSLLHFAIVILLIGVLASAGAKQTSEIQDAKPNSTIETLGLRIELKNFTVYTGTGTVQLEGAIYPEYSALRMDVAILQGGITYNSALWIRLYTAYGITSMPLIIRTVTGDIYVHMLPTDSMVNALIQALMDKEVMPENLIVTVERIPMVYLVWTGVTLLTIGMAIPLIKELVKPDHNESYTD